MNRKEFRAEFKVADDGRGFGSFEGMASVFSNRDRQGEVVLPGAFAKSLPRFISAGFLAVSHDWSEPIGTIDEARETDRGLWVRGEFHSTPKAQQARAIIRERIERRRQVAMSIGYNVILDSRGKNGDRLLKELELFEVSVVTVPANPEAAMIGAKHYRNLEQEMRNIMVSRMRREFLDSLAK